MACRLVPLCGSMQLFSEYTKLLEAYIETELGALAPGFDMRAFCASLSERADMVSLDLDTLGNEIHRTS